MYVDGNKDHWESKPEDTVSCSHDVKGINNSASTDVVERAIIVWIHLKRDLKENTHQIHTDESLRYFMYKYNENWLLNLIS